MFRILSNGLAAVGLAAVVALVALMSGSVASKPAEAAVGITVSFTAGAQCGQTTVTATAMDGATPQVGVTVNFVTSLGSVTPSSAVTNASGVATTTLNTYSVSGVATVQASGGGTQGSGQISVTNSNNCGGGSNCTVYTYSCGGGCYTGSAYNCGTGCDPIYGCGGNCYYGTVYTCGGNCYAGNAYNCGNTCGIYTSACGTCGVYTTACSTCGVNYYSGCGTTCANTIYSGCNTGCGTTYYNSYGCVGNCAGSLSYQSCTPPTCGNINGPILNCSNAYVPNGNLQYTPARVSILPSASTIACGGATAITVVASDANGFKVPDGTNVTFTTSLGYIQGSDQTQGGTAVGSLTIPPGTSGNAKVTASAGGQSADTTINVTCASGAPAVAIQTLPAAPAIPFPFPFPTTGGRPSILPPSTGDAGLLAE